MASKSSNRAEVPEAKEALDRFKMEVANELGVPLSNGYNGNLTSAQTPAGWSLRWRAMALMEKPVLVSSS